MATTHSATSAAPAKTGVVQQAEIDITPETLAGMDLFTGPVSPSAPAKAWLERISSRNPLFGPLEMAVEALAACPQSFRLSPDYAVLAGMICARFILEDRAEDELMLPAEQKIVSPALLNAFLRLCSPWTGFPPVACYYLLASLDPKSIFAMLVVWPKRWLVLRPFFLGVVKGFLIFPAELDPAWTEDMLDVLDSLCAYHRRPLHKGTSIF